MKNRSKLVKSVTAVSTAAVMVAQMLCSILPVSAETVAYDKGTVSVELSSDRQYLNISGKVEDKQNIQDVSVYEMPSFQDEQNTDYSSLTPIGVVDKADEAVQEKPDSFVIEDFENGVNGWTTAENASEGALKEWWFYGGPNTTALKDQGSTDPRNFDWDFQYDGLMPASGSYYFRAKKNAGVHEFSWVTKTYDQGKLLDLDGYRYIQLYFESAFGGNVWNKGYTIEIQLLDKNSQTLTRKMVFHNTDGLKTIKIIPVTFDLLQNDGNTDTTFDMTQISQIKIGWKGNVDKDEDAGWRPFFSIDGIIAAKEPVYPVYKRMKYEGNEEWLQGYVDDPSTVYTTNSLTLLETDFENWKAGQNTKKITIVDGSGFGDRSAGSTNQRLDVESNKRIEAAKADVDPRVFSEVYKEYAAGEELDLSGYRRLMFDLHKAWGGAAASGNPENYVWRLELKAADGTTFTAYALIMGEAWHTVGFNIAEFAERNKISRISVSFALHQDVPAATDSWPCPFWISSMVGSTTGASYASYEYVHPQTDTLDDFEEGANGWTAGEKVDDGSKMVVESGEQFGDQLIPPNVYQGEKMLSLAMRGDSYATDPHYVQKQFDTPKDLSAYRNLVYTIYGMHGATSTSLGYVAHLRLTGKDGTQKSYIQYINAGGWRRVSFDISHFTEISQVSKIELGFSALDSKSLPADMNGCWPGMFWIDDIQLVKEWQTPAERYANGTLEEDGSFLFQIPLEEVADITDKFVVAVTYKSGKVKLVDHFRYIKNPEVLADNTMPAPDAGTIKGMGASLAEIVRNNTLQVPYNIPMDQLLTMSNHGDSTVVYYYKGQPYYFNKEFLDHMESVIVPRGNEGVVNYGILLLYPNNLDMADSPCKFIKHPDADTNTNFMAVNLLDQRGVDYYGAIVSFLAERYSGDHPEHGRISKFIIGNEITDQKNWHNMGTKTLDEFVEQYEWQLRMTNTLLKSVATSSEVYVPVEHSWGIAPSNGYKGKELFEKLNECTKAAGDYDWNVAYHAYPANMFDPRTWRDDVTDDFNTTLITFKNIQVLPQFFQQSNMMYNGKQRRIALTEQGFHTRYTELDEETAELEQAAGFAYGYYKVAATPGIDMFLLHRAVDGSEEGDFRFGAWTRLEGTTAECDRPKKINEVVRYIDTDRSKEVTQFALDFIIKDMDLPENTTWQDLIPELTDEVFAKITARPATLEVNAGYPAEQKNEKVLTENTTDNWIASMATQTPELVDDTANDQKVVKAEINSTWMRDKSEYYGIKYQLPEGQSWDFTDHPVLTITMKAENVGGYEHDVRNLFRVCSSDGYVLEGTAKTVGDRWETLAIDLSDFKGKAKVNRIDVWAAPFDDVIWHVGSISVAKIAQIDKTDVNKFTITSDVDKVTDEGQKVKFTVTNKGSSNIDGMITFTGQNGLTVDIPSQKIKLAVNASQTFTGTVTGLDKVSDNKCGEISVTLCGLSETLKLTDINYSDYLVDGNDWVLGDFESALTDGWVCGDYVETMSSVPRSTRVGNEPSAARHGNFCLELLRVPTAATTPSYVVKNFKKPLDLTDHSRLFLSFCGWGGSSRLYVVDIVLTASDGTQKTYTKTTNMVWNDYEIDISDFAKRDSVTSIAIGYYGIDKYYYAYDWPGCFFLDNIRALPGKGSLKPETEYQKLLEPITTITDSSGKATVSGLSVLPGSQLTKVEYATSGSAYDSEAQLAAQFKQAKLMGVYQLQTEYGEEGYTPIGAVEICLPLPTGYSAGKKYMITHTLSDGTTAYIFPQVEDGKFKFKAAGMGNFAVWSADSENAFRVEK